MLKSCHGQVQAFSIWLRSSQRCRRPCSGRARISAGPSMSCPLPARRRDARRAVSSMVIVIVGIEPCSSAARRSDWRARRLSSQFSPGVQESTQKRRFEARMSAGSVVVLPSTWNSTAEGVSPRTQACRRLFPFSTCCRTQSSIPTELLPSWPDKEGIHSIIQHNEWLLTTFYLCPSAGKSSEVVMILSNPVIEHPQTLPLSQLSANLELPGLQARQHPKGRQGIPNPTLFAPIQANPVLAAEDSSKSTGQCPSTPWARRSCIRKI